MSLSEGMPTMTMPVAPANGSGNGFGFGGDGAWFLIILFLFAFCGWGGNGWGNNAGNSGGVVDGYVLASDFSNIERKMDLINGGLCDGFYAVSKIRLPSSCSMPLCKASKPAQFSVRETFFIRLVSSCAVLLASKVVEKL